MNDDFLAGLGALALGSRLKRLADAFVQQVQQVYDETSRDFRPRWFAVVIYLHRRGPTAITELARALGVSHPAINKVAAELTDAKLVANYRDRKDRRKRVLALTAQGKAQVDALEPVWRQLRGALQSLVDDGGGEFMRALDKLEASLAESSLVERYAGQGVLESSDAVEIVTYREDLQEAFRALNIAWIEHYFTVEPADLLVLDDPVGQVIDKGGEILFALDEPSGDVLGTCTLARLDDDRAELAKMTVTEQARGRGVGQLLGEATIDEARRRGFRVLCLESNRILTPAITLYRKLGFVEASFPHPSDYSRADIYMELDLDRD